MGPLLPTGGSIPPACKGSPDASCSADVWEELVVPFMVRGSVHDRHVVHFLLCLAVADRCNQLQPGELADLHLPRRSSSLRLDRITERS